MKEDDYIRATDLTKVRIIEQILRDILPDINSRVSKEEYIVVLNHVAKWRACLEKDVEEEE